MPSPHLTMLQRDAEAALARRQARPANDDDDGLQAALDDAAQDLAFLRGLLTGAAGALLCVALLVAFGSWLAA